MLYMSTFAKKVTSAVLTSALVLTTAGSTAGVSAALMSQIDAANTLATNGVIVDQSSNVSAYRLADTIQRKEALKVMMKLSDKTVSQGACTSPFSDIADSDWACKYAVAALDAGFIAGNATFRPDDNVSKVEALKMVMKARGIEKSTNADWRAAYVEAAVDAGIAESFSDYNTSATRGTMFVWGAEAINAANVDNNLGDIFGGLLDTNTDTGTTSNTDTGTTSNTDISTTTEDNLTVSLNPETPSDGLAPANTNRVTLLKFDVTAGSQDVTLNEATLDFIGLGDYNNLDEVAIYNAIGEKVSKTKNFSKIERKISFNKDIVVDAGTTMTLTVAGKLSTGGTDNATYGVKLVNIKASSNVAGEDLIGALLVPATFANVASLKINANKQSGNITVGDNDTLVKFYVNEKNNNEDVVIKTITVNVTGTLNTNDLSNLSIYADWTKLDAQLTVNSNDEIVAPVEYALWANKNVTFEIKGSLTGSVGNNVDFYFASNDSIYAVGATSGLPVALQTVISAQDLSAVRTIEGSEINVSFEKGTQDQARPNVDAVSAGSLKLLALTDNYEVKDTTVTVTATGLPTGYTIAQAIENVELGGLSDDNTATENAAITATTAVYHFKDITLKANEALNLPVTFDILDDQTLNGARLNFQVAITKVNDDIENKIYTSTSTPALSTILSSTALDNKNIDIQTAKITLSNVNVIDKNLVIGNGVETVLYKGKISVGDADSVIINDFNLKLAANNNLNGENLNKVVDTATLNIGGKTFTANVNTNSIEFTGISTEIAAGSDNIEVLVSATLKDNNNIVNGNILALDFDTATFDVDNSDGNALTASAILTGAANNKPTKTILKSEGTFQFAIINNGNNKNDIQNVVLAGSKDVALAEFKMEADLEDINVNSLKIKLSSTSTVTTPAVVAPAALSITQAVVTAPAVAAPINEVTKITVNTAPTANGNIDITVNGTTTSVAVLATDSAAWTATKIAAAIGATATATNDVVLVTDTAGINQTDATANVNTTNAAIQIDVLTQGNATPTATPSVDTLTFNRGIANGETWDGQSTLAAYAANLVATDPTIVSATVSGLVVTITGDAAGTTAVTAAVPLPTLVGTPTAAAASTATVVADSSDTFTNIRLMDGSTVIADGGVATFDGTNTVIEFKNFTVKDGQTYTEGTLVADIRNYTTNGDKTSAVLGNVSVNAFTAPANLAAVTLANSEADIDGISSNNTILATPFAGNTNSTAVAIVPATVDVAVTKSYGFNQSEAKLSFTINTGNNVLTNSDVTINKINFVNGASDVANIDNDNNVTVFTSGTTATAGTVLAAAIATGDDKLVSGDVYTLYTTPSVIATPTSTNVKIGTNGITFTVDGVQYTSSNNNVITLGSYSK